MSCEIINGQTILILFNEDLNTGSWISGYYLLWNTPLFSSRQRTEHPFQVLASEIQKQKSDEQSVQEI